MQTPLKLDIWLQSYEKYLNAKNNIKNLTLFLPMSRKQDPTHFTFVKI